MQIRRRHIAPHIRCEAHGEIPERGKWESDCPDAAIAQVRRNAYRSVGHCNNSNLNSTTIKFSTRGNMKKIIAISILCASAMPAAYAEEQGGNYVGVALSKPASTTNSSSTGAAVMLGHRYNEYLAGEIAYEDSGAINSARKRQPQFPSPQSALYLWLTNSKALPASVTLPLARRMPPASLPATAISRMASALNIV